jgi:hypothetical protein
MIPSLLQSGLLWETEAIILSPTEAERWSLVPGFTIPTVGVLAHRSDFSDIGRSFGPLLRFIPISVEVLARCSDLYRYR